MVTAAIGSCVLCARTASIADWSPIYEWLTVEGCPCGGFFAGGRVWNQRLPGMPASERKALAARVRNWRVGGREAYLSTADGTDDGVIEIFPERPVVWPCPSARRAPTPPNPLPPAPRREA
jgi:hypothetical protein